MKKKVSNFHFFFFSFKIPNFLSGLRLSKVKSTKFPNIFLDSPYFPFSRISFYFSYILKEISDPVFEHTVGIQMNTKFSQILKGS